jgi:hypothetical protein
LAADVRSSLRRQLCGVRQLEKPAYLELEDSILADFEAVNVLDYLRFDVARAEKTKLLASWWQQPRLNPYALDESLLKSYRFLDQEIDEERQAGTVRVCRQVADRLKSDIQAISDAYKLISVPQDGKDMALWRKSMAEVYKTYKNIEPLRPEGEEEHWLCKMLVADKKMEGTQWQSIRASYLYKTQKNSRLVWTMAGLDLCEMKARAMPPIIPVRARTYGTMKINTKMAKLVSEMSVVPEEEDDADLLDEDEETQFFDAQTSIEDSVSKRSIRDYYF